MRREKWSIIAAILIAIEEEHARNGRARLSHVAASANIPYDRLRGYLERLLARDLITSVEEPCLTPKGRELIQHYQRWASVVDRFGLGNFD